MFEKLLYLPIDIDNAPLTCLEKLNDSSFESFLRDDYRNCYQIPLMTIIKSTQKYEWTETAKEFPDLMEWAEDCIFPWTGRSRIMIITTPAGHKNPPHIDCSPPMFQTLQHKFRYVLQGNVDDLVFMSRNKGDQRLSKVVDKPFIMSGKWPHWMHNTTDNTKFTFAFGSPWDGDLSNPHYIKVLNRSYELYKDCYLSYEYLKLPMDFKELFQHKYYPDRPQK